MVLFRGIALSETEFLLQFLYLFLLFFFVKLEENFGLNFFLQMEKAGKAK